MCAKYIVHKGIPIVFPEGLTHAIVCRQLFHDVDVESAGFVQIIRRDDGLIKIHCYGESCSLGVRSRGQIDSNLLRDVFQIDEADFYKGVENTVQMDQNHDSSDIERVPR